MDIEAKHMPADEHGVRIAELDEMSYREKLWEHTPLTDFWRIGPGYNRRLNKLGIHNMGELALYSLTGADKVYSEFGVAAELIIDHAWGYEPVKISDIKNYKTRDHSVSSGQVLRRPYKYKEARLVTWEMADNLALDLFSKNIVADKVVLTVCYDKNTKDYNGPMHKDHYGRNVPKPAHGTINLQKFTNYSKVISNATMELFDKIVNPELNVRAIYVVLANAKINDGITKPRQLNIFTDYEKEERDDAKERNLQKAMVKIKKRYGKNAILKADNLDEGATMRERNMQVGGHRG